MEDRAIMRRKVVHFIPYMHVRFFLSNLQDRALLRSKIFITMATTCPLYRARSCIMVILRAEFDATVRLREKIALVSQENKKKTKQNKLNCCSEQLFGVLDCRCLACVQTSPPFSGKNRERRRRLLSRFFPEGGGDVCTQASRCSSWQRGMKGTTQASGAVSTSAGTCWHNFYKQDSGTW